MYSHLKEKSTNHILLSMNEVFETFPYTPIELWTPDLAMFFYEIHASELYRLGGILAGIGSPRMDVIRPRVPKLHIKYQYNVAVARKAIIGHQGLVAHEYWSQQWINDPFVIELSIKLNAEHNFPLLSEQRKTSQLFQRLAASSRRPFLYDLSSKELIAMALRKAYPLNNLVSFCIFILTKANCTTANLFI